MRTEQDNQLSTIAELVFVSTPALNFARLVGDLDAVLARFHDLERHLTWDCEDIATFDMPGTRIVLATYERPRPGVDCVLTLSVGPSHLPPRLNAAPLRNTPPVRHAALCAKLVDRVQARLRPDAIFWHEVPSRVGPDLIDALAQDTPEIPDAASMAHPVFRSVEEGVQDIFARGFRPSNDRPEIPRLRNPELTALRAALYPPEEPLAPPLVSTQMRLAAHTMNATLIMVALPVGAAMLTYSVLRGENMRLTSAALVATGFASTLLQSQFGQQIASFAGS